MNGKPSALAFDLRLPGHIRHQIRTLEAQRRRSAAIAVVHRLRRPLPYFHPEHRHLLIARHLRRTWFVLPCFLVHSRRSIVLACIRRLAGMRRRRIPRLRIVLGQHRASKRHFHHQHGKNTLTNNSHKCLQADLRQSCNVSSSLVIQASTVAAPLGEEHTGQYLRYLGCHASLGTHHQ